ncbi:MAG: hypothetical protein ABIH04_02775, partial [Planctomycetota bacterium]
MKRLGIAITATFLFSFLAASQADATNWTGTTGSWHNPANWDGGVPTSSHYALINNGGTAQISAGAESFHLYAGYSGSGAVEQTAGTNTVSSDLWLGYQSGTSGTYSLSAGALSVGYSEYIGSYGTGEFNQTGGTHTVSNNLLLGRSSSGTFNLSAGDLSAGSEYIGYYYGTGEFNQTGGTNTVGYLFVKNGSSYNFSGGTLSIGDSAEINGS